MDKREDAGEFYPGGKVVSTRPVPAGSNYFDGAEYVQSYGAQNRPALLFKHGSQVLVAVDATPFVKDGIVSNVEISGGNLVITFNTDSGKQPISIPLTYIFNPNAYYDKTAADARFATKADATLAERGFSEWSATSSAPGTYRVAKWDSPGDAWDGWWKFEAWGQVGEEEYDWLPVAPPGTTGTNLDDPNATSIAMSYNGVSCSATRVALSGYQLGSQTGKPLASEAEAEALRAEVATKAGKPAAFTAGNLAKFDSEGNPVDSGKKPADFATSAQGQKANTALQGVKVGSSTVTPDSNRVVSLGTAAAKNVPASGDASSTQVVMGNDSRLPKAEDSVQRLLDNASPSAKTAVTVGVRSTENAADRGQASLAVGDHPKASGPNAVATGTWTEATAPNARADGNLCKATNNGAHSEGNNTQATGPFSHTEGSDTAAPGLVAHAEGNYTTAPGTGAHTEGMFTRASGPGAHAEGSSLDKLADLLQAAGASAEIVALFRQAATDAAGSFSHTEGLVTATSEMGSHAQGFRASDGGNPFSFVWQGYSGVVPTAAQMQALLSDPTSQDAQAALQCLVTALTARAAYTSKGRGTFCINPAPQGGSTDPKTGFFVGDESLDKALRYSFHAAVVGTGLGAWSVSPSSVILVASGQGAGLYWSPVEVGVGVTGDPKGNEDSTELQWTNGVDAGRNISATRSQITSVTDLADRAINTATLGSSVTVATVSLPSATAGYARDFFVDLTIEATTAPTLTFIDPATGTTANVAFGADSLADIAPGYNLVLWTELPNNRWLVSVKHEEAT